MSMSLFWLCSYVQSSDKLVVEIFPEPEQQDDRVRSILERLVSPGNDVGGDSRLLIPSDKNVVTAEEQIGSQVSPIGGPVAFTCHKDTVFSAVSFVLQYAHASV